MELEKLKQEHNLVVENLNFQNTKYKAELEELTQFKTNKVIFLIYQIIFYILISLNI